MKRTIQAWQSVAVNPFALLVHLLLALAAIPFAIISLAVIGMISLSRWIDLRVRYGGDVGKQTRDQYPM